MPMKKTTGNLIYLGVGGAILAVLFLAPRLFPASVSTSPVLRCYLKVPAASMPKELITIDSAASEPAFGIIEIRVFTDADGSVPSTLDSYLASVRHGDEKILIESNDLLGLLLRVRETTPPEDFPPMASRIIEALSRTPAGSSEVQD